MTRFFLDPPTWYFLLLGVLLVILVGVLPALLAARKGYAWYCWVFSALLGLIILAFLPYTNLPGQSEEAIQQKRKMGNTVGAVLSVLTILGIMADALGTLFAG